MERNELMPDNQDAPHLNPQIKLDQLALKMEILRGMSALGDRAGEDEQIVSAARTRLRASVLHDLKRLVDPAALPKASAGS
jgi:hypothetical protein